MGALSIGRMGMFCALATGLVVFFSAGRASAQWTPYVPTARQTDANVSSINGAWRSTIHFTFPDPGYRVTWGAMRKSRNVLYVTATVEKSTARRAPYITYIGRTYPLGPMDRGNYRLRVVVNGRTVRETTFTVSRPTRS